MCVAQIKGAAWAKFCIAVYLKCIVYDWAGFFYMDTAAHAKIKYWLTDFPLIIIGWVPRNNYGDLKKSKQTSIKKNEYFYSQ